MKNALIRRQAARDARLGELLLRRGIIDATELRAMLSLQAELRAANGSGVLAQRYRLERLLADTGIVERRALEQALPSQPRHLAAATIASVALSTGTALPAVAGDTTTLQLSATVLARASIVSQRLPHDVLVSALDVERGYVDLQEPIEIAVRSNHPRGVMLDFAANSSQLTVIDVNGAGGTVFVPPRERGLQHHSLSLKLRLKLAPDAVPGSIRFPVSVSLTPA